MCLLPALAASGGGGLKGIARSGMLGLAGLAGSAMGGHKPDRQQTLYPNDMGGR